MTDTKRGRFTSAFWRSLGVFLLSIPMGSNAVEISNGIPEGTVGHYRVDVTTGGETRVAFVTAARLASNDIIVGTDIVFDYFSYVDPGIDGGGFQLVGSDPVPNPINPNIVTSNGSFTGFNQNRILWTAVSSIAPGAQVMTTTYTFTAETGVLGPLRFLQYLDEDVQGPGDDVFFFTGSAASGDLELFTFDNTDVYGLSHSGALLPGTDLQNASFAGWAADRFNNMKPLITGIGQPVSPAGIITNLQGFQHPQLGPVFGPADPVSVLGWDVEPNAASAVITTSLGGEAGVIEAAPVIEGAPARLPIPCQRKNCTVLIFCISADLAVPCNNAITVSVRQPRRSSVSEISGEVSDGRRAKAPRMVPFASGAVSNVPPSQIANVKLKITKKGRRIAQSGVKKLRGEMNISNVAGSATLRIPVRIKLK